MITTSKFKMRFHNSAFSEKVKATRLLAEIVKEQQMPGGRSLMSDERLALNELLEWCNLNCFFDVKPSENNIK